METWDLGFTDEKRTALEFGAQGIYYLFGNFGKGTELGLDARTVRFKGDGKLMELGDGVAVGPFIGYKRIFGPGVTLEAQLGVQAAFDKDDTRAIAFAMLGAGWSFWQAGDVPPEPPTEALTSSGPVDPFDLHKGWMILALDLAADRFRCPAVRSASFTRESGQPATLDTSSTDALRCWSTRMLESRSDSVAW